MTTYSSFSLQATRLIFVAAVLLLSMRPAHAYLDPGTGSLLLQMLIGGLSAALAIAAGFWARIVAVFRRRLTDRSDPRPPPSRTKKPYDVDNN